jgi:hypothetical protein
MTRLIVVGGKWIQPAHVKHLELEPGRQSCRVYVIDGHFVTVPVDHNEAAQLINEALEKPR